MGVPIRPGQLQQDQISMASSAEVVPGLARRQEGQEACRSRQEATRCRRGSNRDRGVGEGMLAVMQEKGRSLQSKAF